MQKFQKYTYDERELIAFDCPGCNISHSFTVKSNKPGEHIWKWNGDLDGATFEPSLLVKTRNGEVICHSFVRDGNIIFQDDCTHSLAGKTVEVPLVGAM